MKLPRLPDTALAQFMNLPPGPQLDQALRMHKAGFGKFSYDPVRGSTSDLVRAKTPLLGEVPSPDWAKLVSQITGLCTRGSPEIQANLEVARALFLGAQAHEWVAARVIMEPLRLVPQTISFWSGVVVGDAGGLFVPCFDFRRSGGLETAAVRRIVYSLQHVGVREQNPDLIDARLAIVRFPVIEGKRVLKVYPYEGGDLIGYEELQKRARNVYDAWARIYNERYEALKAAGGGAGPFGF